MLERNLKPVAGLDADALLGMTETSYIELVQWTGEQAGWASGASGRRRLISGRLPITRISTGNGAVAVCELARKKPRWSAVVRGFGKCRAPRVLTTGRSDRRKH